MTVVLDQVEIRLTVEQVITAIKQLPPLDQALVRKALDIGDGEWQQRFDRLLISVRTKVDAEALSTGAFAKSSPCAGVAHHSG